MGDGGRPWDGPGRGAWLGAVAAWLSEVLDEPALELEPVKERPWGAVLRVHAPDRPLYLKAVGPRGGHEVPLLRDLALRCPGLAPDVVAVDEERGWIVMADHGPAVAEVADVPAQLAAIESLLPPYAALQRACAPLVDGWTDAGVPDRSPSALAGMLDRLLAGHGALGPVGVAQAEVERFRGLRTVFERTCERLAATAVPRSIDHADLHGWNVVVGDGAPRLIDWGDACVTHPFSSLLVPIEWVAARLPREQRAEAVARSCDAYLAPWGVDGDLEVLGLAVWVGYVTRALSNDEQCAGGAPDVVRDGQREVAALLRTWAAKADRLDRPTSLLDPMLQL